MKRLINNKSKIYSYNIQKSNKKNILITNSNKHWKSILEAFKKQDNFKIILNKKFSMIDYIITYYRHDLYSWSSKHCCFNRCDKHGIISTSQSLDVLFRYFKYYGIHSIQILKLK